MVDVRPDEQLNNHLTAITKKTNHSKSVLAKQVLGSYIDDEERKQLESDLALARWKEYQKTGETVSNHTVMDWLATWGSEIEKPCPVKSLSYRVSSKILPL